MLGTVCCQHCDGVERNICSSHYRRKAVSCRYPWNRGQQSPWVNETQDIFCIGRSSPFESFIAAFLHHLSTSDQGTDAVSVMCTRPHRNLVAGNWTLTLLHYYTHTSCRMDNSGKKGRENINKHCRKECKLQTSFQFSRQQYIGTYLLYRLRSFESFLFWFLQAAWRWKEETQAVDETKACRRNSVTKRPHAFPACYMIKQVDWSNTLQAHVRCGCS